MNRLLNLKVLIHSDLHTLVVHLTLLWLYLDLPQKIPNEKFLWNILT